MDFVSMLLLGISLSMDALAVSITSGITIRNLKLRHIIKTGVFFGAFQAAMPIIGYIAGSTVAEYIRAVDHWVVFVLLLLIGVNMIREAVKCEDERVNADPTKTARLLVLALATSIDALAVGISLSFIQADILLCALIIGCTTFVLSAAGVALGKRLGDVFRKRAGIIGGVVLIIIGTKILLEHLT